MGLGAWGGSLAWGRGLGNSRGLRGGGAPGNVAGVSKKSAKVAALIAACAGRDLDAHYLAYFECFNRGLYYEAHDVLEPLWLQGRAGPNHGFYKGLIQLTAAFVHLQKNRLRPSAALFNLAQENLRKYPATHERLDVQATLELIRAWRGQLEAAEFQVNPLNPGSAPKLVLESTQVVVT